MDSLQKLAYSFVDDHWDEIDLKKVEIKQSKFSFLRELKTNESTCWWVVSEVMSWGCKQDYLKEFIASWEDGEYMVVKAHDKYYQNDGRFGYKEVFPKTRTVTYFE